MSQPLSFPPEVFARLEPDIYLQRHLALGMRPDCRKFDEFRPSQSQLGTLQNSIGSAVVRSGNTVAVCGITASTTENENNGGIFPNIVINRGGSRYAPPSGEEMVMSQRLYELLQSSDVWNQHYEESFVLKDCANRGLVLNANVQILSRSGPSFDVAFNSVMGAMKNAKIPRIYWDDDFQQVKLDNSQSRPLLFSSQVSSSFGVVEIKENEQNHLGILSDLEGEAEETCINSRINVIARSDGLLSGVSICISDSDRTGRGIHLTKDHLTRVVELAQERAKRD